MGVYAQLNDADQLAVSQLAKYLIETPGNRFYEQNLVAVRNHIAGNDQLIQQAHKFKQKLAEMMNQQAQAVTTIDERVKRASGHPVNEMLHRYQDPKTHTAFKEKVDTIIKQRKKQKKK